MNTIAASLRIAALAWLLLAVSACAGSESAGEEVLVSAAASLTDAIAEIEVAFEDANPGVDVVVNLAGTSTLREQIIEGIPADVFASADRANMTSVVEAGRVDRRPVIFATNSLQIAVPSGNPAGLTTLEDFTNDALLIGLCAPVVPCGAFAAEVFAKAGVVPAVDTYEPNVRALLTKIEAGELDGGVTYVTDVVSSPGTVDGVDIPDELNVVAEYPIALVSEAPNPAGGEAFVEFVLGERGRSILTEYGFGAP